MKKIIAVIAITMAAAGACSTSSEPSLRGKCEQRWVDNRSTAETDYMTHDRYVDNCLQTYKDIGDGGFG